MQLGPIILGITALKNHEESHDKKSRKSLEYLYTDLDSFKNDAYNEYYHYYHYSTITKRRL